MENFFLIYQCEKNKFRVYLNNSNSELSKKFVEINRSPKLIKKFVLVIEAVKAKVANKSQFNFELKCGVGSVYAIKVDKHRFYTLFCLNLGYRELYISRYGLKQSQQNDKKLKAIIESVPKISIQKLLQ